MKRRILNIIRKLSVKLRLLFSSNGRKGRAIIVTGPMRSGTRMVTRFLINCGCSGNGGHHQLYDFWNPEDTDTKVVWRRHPEKSCIGIRVEEAIRLMKKLGYKVTVIRLKRDAEANINSLVDNNFAKDWVDASHIISESNLEIDRAMSRQITDSIEVSYKNFTENNNARKFIAKELGLEYRELEEYENRNKKYEVEDEKR